MVGNYLPLCGDRTIDAGHLELSRRIEDIGLLWKEGASDMALEASVRQARATAASHFIEEIAVLESVGADTDAHRRAHDALLAEIDAMLDDALRHPGYRRWFAILDTLERMFFDHEVMEDRRYYGLLAAARDCERLAG